MCVCAFSLHRESPDMILGDKPLISEVVLSQRRGVEPEDHRVGRPVQEVEGRRSEAAGGEDHPRRNDLVP
jgi:hypothetical protein